jgi:hypothetical protein
MKYSDSTPSKQFQKPATRRTDLPSPVPELNRDPHWLIAWFLWLLPTALLTGASMGLGKFGYLFGSLLDKLGIEGRVTRENIGAILMLIVLLASIAGPGLIFSILTMRGQRDRGDLSFRSFQFFLAQLLLIPTLIFVFYWIRKLIFQ